MARKEGNKPYIEVQKGPVSVEDQYSLNFRREPQSTMRDMENLKLRQDKSTLTLHTPKRWNS
jgi:hypothetical protein